MSTLSISEVLDRAADLIEPEGAWTQGAGARDANGVDLPPDRDHQAVCWCIGGALYRVTRHSCPEHPVQRFLDRLLDGFVNWNDAPERTQPEVVAKLREAAKLAREQGK